MEMLVKPPTKLRNSAGIILNQTIVKLAGRDVGTEIEIHVTEDSLVLKRHLAAGRRSTDRPPEK